MTYSPKTAPVRPTAGGEPPSTEMLAALVQYVEIEFEAIARNFSETQELELRVRSAEPLRPRDGMLVDADGTNWNPGAGEGLYRRHLGAWVRVGTGAAGTPGAIGQIGPPGYNGIDGADGSMGPQGNPGTTGATGLTGLMGLPGPPGPAGEDGETGQFMLSGASGGGMDYAAVQRRIWLETV